MIGAQQLGQLTDGMVRRYGDSVLAFAMADPGTADEARQRRAMQRQYCAVLRLTRALADLAGGAR